MQVDILAPPVWQPLIEAASSRVDGRRLAALITAVHGRHAGLPPHAAAGWLDQEHAGWKAFRMRIAESLTTHDRQERPEISARLWSLLPQSLIVLRGVVPISLAVCRGLGRSVLFGRFASSSGVPLDYDEYSRSFDAGLESAVRDVTLLGAVFWNRLAFTLYSAALARSSSPRFVAARHPLAPHTDAGALHWIKRLEPEFSTRERRRAPLQIQMQINPDAPKPKREGVQGIRMSRSYGDIADRLMSEQIYPSVLQADRMINTGMLVRHRPPPNERMRDILVAGLIPCRDATSGFAFMRAVWLDAVHRLAVQLIKGGVRKSDLAFAAATGVDSATSALVRLDNREELGGDEWRLRARERVGFLKSAGWLPGLIDRLPRRTFSPNAPPAPDYVTPTAAGWLGRVFRRWPPLPDAEVQAGGEHSFENYGAVHVHLIMPVAEVHKMSRAAEHANLRGTLGRIVGLDRAQTHGLTVIGVPPTPWEDFLVLPREAARTIPAADQKGRSTDRLAADLVEFLVAETLGSFDG